MTITRLISFRMITIAGVSAAQLRSLLEAEQEQELKHQRLVAAQCALLEAERHRRFGLAA